MVIVACYHLFINNSTTHVTKTANGNFKIKSVFYKNRYLSKILIKKRKIPVL